MDSNQEDTRKYIVVINHEEQYSIWLADSPIPKGWRADGMEGSKAECLAHVAEVWTDMRPLSVRKHMEALERERRKSPPQRASVTNRSLSAYVVSETPPYPMNLTQPAQG